MATLFNTKISATYPGLFKTIDNTAITAALKELTDGDGNQSGLYLNTAGDFKVTAVLEWGSLKDTGTGVVVTQFVTSVDGIENFNNDTTLPTSAAVKLYVDTKFSTTDTLTEVLGFGNTTSGYDIAVSAGDDITFTDTSKILMGAGSDLQIYHDGANSYIKDAGTGNLEILADSLSLLNAAGSEYYARFYTNGAAYLYHNGVARLNTSGTGAEVTGDLVVTGTITGSGGSFLPLAGGTMTGNIVLNDNVRAQFGASNDLQIYHDSNVSFIRDDGTGGFYLTTNGDAMHFQDNTGEYMAKFVKDGAVELYYDNSKKLETTSAGATITGALSTTTNVEVGANATFVDNGKAQFGTGNDLEIYHDGSNSYIQDSGTGDLRVDTSTFRLRSANGGETMIRAFEDGAVILSHNNFDKLSTISTGVSVTGDLEVTGTITGSGGSFLPLAGGTMTGNTIHNDNAKSFWGDANDLGIYHDGTNSYIGNTTGEVFIKSGDDLSIQDTDGTNRAIFQANAQKLYYDGDLRFETSITGISVTGNGAFTGSVSVPDAGQVQLGTNDDAQVYHDGANFYANNSTGQLNIDQAAVTESIVFRTSDANALDVTALTINRSGDLITGRDVTIAGDLTVNGTTTTVNSQTLSVDDPLISLAINNSANSLDIGYYGKYNDGTTRYLGLFSDASDSNKFKLFKGTTVEPTTTVNIGAAGYVAADLVVAGLEAGSATFSGANANNKIQTYYDGSFISGWKFSDLNGGIWYDAGLDDLTINSGFAQGQIIFNSGGTTALTLDASQNATFAGTIDSGTITSTGIIKTATTFQSTGGSMLFFVPNVGQALEIAQNTGNATFAGDVTIDNGTNSILIIEKDATGNGKIQFNDAGSQAAYIALDASEDVTYYAAGGNEQIFYAGGVLNETKSGATSTFSGDVTIGSSGAGSDKTLNILTGGTKSSVKLMEAGTVYGFSTVYDGAANAFHINRHNNSAAGSPVLSFNRDDDNATFTGDVGIGTSTPLATTHISASGNLAIPGLDAALGTATSLVIGNEGGTVVLAAGVSNTNLSWLQGRQGTGTGNAFDIGLNPLGGNVSIGSTTNAGYRLKVESAGTVQLNNRTGSDGTVFAAAKDGTIVGSITVTGSATAFNTSSDYRLKEDLQDFNGLEMVSSIPVYDHKWKVDDSRSYGVMAHELQEVLPQAVSGEKDAEEMQSVDYSKIVPVLLKAIQELTAKVETLEANACKCKN